MEQGRPRWLALFFTDFMPFSKKMDEKFLFLNIF